MSTKDKDRGWKRIKRNLLLLDGSFTKVGLPQNGKLKSVSGGQIEDMSQLVIVGAVHEFGATKAGKSRNVVIPERSFMRSTFDENVEKLKTVKEKLYDKYLRHQISSLDALGLLGEFMTSKIQLKIKDLRTPPNAPSTIKAKTRAGNIGDNPLINFGQLRQSIQHVEVLK